MSLALDHLVIRVADLERAIRDYGELGFTVQRGGTHADGVTHNALIGFADGSYLELIAFLKPGTEHRWETFRARDVEGFIDFALLPDDIAARIAATNTSTRPYAGPFDGGRLRPDGERLVWRIGQPPSGDLPFLCGDVTPRALRVREGDVRRHPNGVLGITSLTVAVRDLRASLAGYQALLGPDAVHHGGIVPLPGLGIEHASVQLIGTRLELVAAGAAPASPAARLIEDLLARRGEGVMGAALSGATGGPRQLPVDKTHGAVFEHHA